MHSPCMLPNGRSSLWTVSQLSLQPAYIHAWGPYFATPSTGHFCPCPQARPPAETWLSTLWLGPGLGALPWARQTSSAHGVHDLETGAGAWAQRSLEGSPPTPGAAAEGWGRPGSGLPSAVTGRRQCVCSQKRRQQKGLPQVLSRPECSFQKWEH